MVFSKKIDNVKVQCSLCNKLISHDGNTTNLNRHLKNKHTVAFNTYKEQMQTEKQRAEVGNKATQDLNPDPDEPKEETLVLSRNSTKRSSTSKPGSLNKS